MGTPGGEDLVVAPNALRAYFQRFRKLARGQPEAWYLCLQAEDRCRAEHMPRLRRQMAEETGTAPTWSQVFVAASLDHRYWDEEVRHPAIDFLARGSKRSRPDPAPTSLGQ